MRNTTNVLDSNNQEIFEDDNVEYSYCYNEVLHTGKIISYKNIWLIESNTEQCKPFLQTKAFSHITTIGE